MADEIVIKVEGETPPEPPAPVAIVTEGEPLAPAGDALGAAVVVMSLESLAAENTELRGRIEGLESSREHLYERIGSIEDARIVEEVAEETAAVAVGELVTEIPPPILPEDSEKPKERKRRFI